MTSNENAVRVSTLTDISSVTALLQAAYPVQMEPAYDASVLRPALKLMTQAQPKLLDSGTFYVAESRDGSLIGCGGWTLGRPGDGVVKDGVGHIRHFGTHPEWTRQGIGRAIFSRCEIDASSAGVSRFECYSSLNAEPFYSALGFEPIGRVDIEMASNVFLASVHMSRRLR